MSSTRSVVVEGPPRSTSMPSVDVRGSHFLASVSLSSPSPPPSHTNDTSPPHVAPQTRTGMFFKKVTMLGHTRRKSEERRSGSMFPRQARSMELGNKPFGMSQPVLGVSTEQQSMTDNEGSECSPTGTASPSLPSSRRVSAVPKLQTPKAPVTHSSSNPSSASYLHPSTGLPTITQTPPSPVVSGLPASSSPLSSPIPHVPKSSSSHESSLGDTESHDSVQTFHSAAESVISSSSEQSVSRRGQDISANSSSSHTPPQTAKSGNLTSSQLSATTSIPPERSQSLPSRNMVSPNATPSVSGLSTPTASSVTPSDSQAPTPKPLHPRLASLPPPLMARYATQGSVRLTPSIVHRQPPMPILNLPQLPQPTPPPTEAQIRSPVRLRSVPALPLRGPSEAEDADHENADLDDMEDVEEEDEEDTTPGHASDEDAQSSPSVEMPAVEVPSMGRRLRSPLQPSLTRSPRSPMELPQVDTSRLGLAFGTPTPGAAGPSNITEVNRGTMYFTPTDPVPPTDILRTPVPAFRKVATPSGHSHTDYFSSKPPERPSTRGSTHDHTRTPRPTDYHEGVVAPKTVPMPNASPRPGLYQQASKSMVDLLSVSRKEKEKQATLVDNRRSHVPDYETATSRDTPSRAASPAHIAAPALRRQRSLPMYTIATEPPPYPSFQPRMHPPIATPREEEGREQLPPYTNSIYLAAVMPRKMEFNAPGVQARDRKWKRTYCVLEGTMFKVYRVHNGVVEDWWERTVGAGDKTSVDPGAIGAAGSIRVSAIRESERQRSEFSKGEASPPPADDSTNGNSQVSSSITPSHTRSKLLDLLHPSRGKNDRLGIPSSASRSRVSFDTSRDESRTPAASAPRRQSLDSARSGPSSSASSRILGRNGSGDSSNPPASGSTSATSLSSTSSSRTPTPTPAISHFSSISTTAHEPEGEPDQKDLLRQYTLQGAESGLASDYIKRKNVIRVRMEGEQFLLQAKDVPAVIEWIEGIQAATNVSLDLDERPMPKGPMFPRRRRRRPRRPEDQGQGQASGSANATTTSIPGPVRAS